MIYVKRVALYKWNEDKNSILKATRGFSFNDVVEKMSKNGILDNYKQPNKEKYHTKQTVK